MSACRHHQGTTVVSGVCIEIEKKQALAEKKHCPLAPPSCVDRRIGEGQVQCEMKTKEVEMCKGEDSS